MIDNAVKIIDIDIEQDETRQGNIFNSRRVSHKVKRRILSHKHHMQQNEKRSVTTERVRYQEKDPAE